MLMIGPSVTQTAAGEDVVRTKSCKCCRLFLLKESHFAGGKWLRLLADTSYDKDIEENGISVACFLLERGMA